MAGLDPVVFRELPVIQKVIDDETWYEGERRGCYVSSEDPVVRENVCLVILRIGRHTSPSFVSERYADGTLTEAMNLSHGHALCAALLLLAAACADSGTTAGTGGAGAQSAGSAPTGSTFAGPGNSLEMKMQFCAGAAVEEAAKQAKRFRQRTDVADHDPELAFLAHHQLRGVVA
jgi:hypothetical protein